MKNKVQAGIIGGAGYTGGELIRILIHHPAVEIAFVQSNSNANNLISNIHEDLIGETSMKFSSTITNIQFEQIDVLFFCAGHGEAAKFINQNKLPDSLKLIDIGNDFRLAKDADLGNRKFIYGLPELNRDNIKSAQNIANPGCFATAIQLGLLPLAKQGLLDEVYTTGITGSTGAGQSLSASSHFSWRANNIQPYKTLTHQHLGEINESIQLLQPIKNVTLNFVPWRGDFTRGIFVSSQLKCNISISDLNSLFETYYKEHPFVQISDTPIFLKQVVNTNKCLIQLEKNENQLVVHSALDNLLKGASGQAIQNMNLLFGLDETIGLQLKANYF